MLGIKLAMVVETASKVRITFAWDALRELYTMRGSSWRWKCYADIVVQPKVLSALLCLSLVSSLFNKSCATPFYARERQSPLANRYDPLSSDH